MNGNRYPVRATVHDGSRATPRYGNCSCTCHFNGGRHPVSPCCGPGSPGYDPSAAHFDPSLDEGITPQKNGITYLVK